MWKKITHHRWIYLPVFVFAFSFISFFGLSQNTFATTWDNTFTSFSSVSGYLRPMNYNWDNSFVIKKIEISLTVGSLNQTNYSSPLFEFRSDTNAMIPVGGMSFPYLGSFQNTTLTQTLEICENTFPLTYIWYDFKQTWFQNSVTSVYIKFYDDCGFSGITPSGSLSISENGTYDVTNYAEAVVDVPSVGGDYSDDLQDVKNAILIGIASLFVIYFFWAIYKMIMGAVRR